MLGDRRRTIESNELEAYYEPKADVRSGRIVGCEALVRWYSPKRGYIAPMEFVAYAERTGVIRLLTASVLRSAFVQLRSHGVWFAIDDFGTGYSSLASLQRPPVDEFKIDRAFVRQLGAESNDGVIMRSTVDLGHAMGLKVVAERVEDETASRSLRASGCDLAQGYRLARPAPRIHST